ncbi:MAG: hypothetical protein AAF170_02790, partial [Bacteroidota bacterium]
MASPGSLASSSWRGPSFQRWRICASSWRVGEGDVGIRHVSVPYELAEACHRSAWRRLGEA